MCPRQAAEAPCSNAAHNTATNVKTDWRLMATPITFTRTAKVTSVDALRLESFALVY